ncbi:sugar phosphate isomerase/epimerase family protein [Streptomyces sp. NPDC049954]|uniref:sugar phosphate isomerase/epimerase family protein n=1 Tax=Streptomyces sp. NPDC049954 TaxID=3155779 RepID=UPI003433D46C
MTTTCGSARTWAVGASTLGAPGEELATVLRWLSEAAVRTMELRVAHGQPVHVDSGPERRARVRAQIADSGVELLSCSSYVRLASEAQDRVVVDDLKRHLELTADLGARFLRVFPGAATLPGPGDRPPGTVHGVREADESIVRRLAAVTTTAEGLGVRPVLETHGSHPRGQDVARVLRALDERSPDHRVGAVWDFEHPFRTGEAPARTWEEIGRRVRGGRGFVQIKDVRSVRDQTPVLVGHGVLPLATMVDVLDTGGYTGPLSLEWERTWHPEVAPLPVALGSLNDWLGRQAPAVDRPHAGNRNGE